MDGFVRWYRTLQNPSRNFRMEWNTPNAFMVGPHDETLSIDALGLGFDYILEYEGKSFGVSVTEPSTSYAKGDEMFLNMEDLLNGDPARTRAITDTNTGVN